VGGPRIFRQKPTEVVLLYSQEVGNRQDKTKGTKTGNSSENKGKSDLETKRKKNVKENPTIAHRRGRSTASPTFDAAMKKKHRMKGARQVL